MKKTILPLGCAVAGALAAFKDDPERLIRSLDKIVARHPDPTAARVSFGLRVEEWVPTGYDPLKLPEELMKALFALKEDSID